MSFVRNRNVNVAVDQTPADLPDAPVGMLSTTTQQGAYYLPSAAKRRSRLERLTSGVVVVAALMVVVVLLGVILPPLVSGLIAGFYMGLFAAVLTLLNLTRPSGWANSVLGRQVFPVVHARDNELWRLSWVNGVLMFLFGFLFYAISTLLHSGLLAGMIVFAGLIASGVFYSRARKVIIKP